MEKQPSIHRVPICAKCGGNDNCDQYEIIVARALKAEFKSSVVYNTSYSRTFYSSADRAYRAEGSLTPWICRECQSKVYRDAFIVARFRLRALNVSAAILACGLASLLLYFNQEAVDSFKPYVALFGVVLSVWFFGSLGDLFFNGFISKERACAYALQDVLQTEVSRIYQAQKVRTHGQRVRALGEIELFTAGDWEILKKKSEAEIKKEEQNEKWREEMMRTGHWPGPGFFDHLVGGLGDEGRELSESPFSEWLRSARRRAREKRSR